MTSYEINVMEQHTRAMNKMTTAMEQQNLIARRQNEAMETHSSQLHRHIQVMEEFNALLQKAIGTERNPGALFDFAGELRQVANKMLDASRG